VRGIIAATVSLALLAACMTRPPAPVSERTPLARPPAPPPAVATPAPPEREPAPPPTYTVKSGDTLAKIALDNGLDYRELAQWNAIENPNVIRVGQVLVLAAPGSATASAAPASGVTITPLASAPAVGTAPPARAAEPPPPQIVLPSGRANTATLKSEPKAVKLPYSEQALAQLQKEYVPPSVAVASPATPRVTANAAPAAAPSSAPATAAPPASAPAALPARPDAARVPEIDDDKLGWVWPANGKVIAGFSDTANLKGIDIAGKAGQPVVASAAGRVVYAGTGLRGYGKLIIVKHNSTYLSAYAHNRELLVKEGQQVSKGQKISEMGDTDTDQVKLHFEIRRLGKPVDPTKYLPPAS
jgi:lipoprotein NlpD